MAMLKRGTSFISEKSALGWGRLKSLIKKEEEVEEVEEEVEDKKKEK